MYFFGNFCRGRIWSFKWNGATLRNFTERTAELIPNIGSINNISSIGEDAAEELYIVNLNGEIFKINPDNPTAEFTLLPLNPGRAGTTNTLQVTAATPGGEVAFFGDLIRTQFQLTAYAAALR